MLIGLFVLLLTVLALLSLPGRFTRNPVTGGVLNDLQSLLAQRSIAVIMMIPVIIVCIRGFSDWLEFSRGAWISIILIALTVPPIAVLSVKRTTDTRMEILFSKLTTGSSQWLFYLLVTVAYMVAYEFLMRGIVLGYLIEHMDVIFAVALNALIYAGMHLFKNLKEALLSLPLGVFLCWITLYTQSIWPAAFFHLTFALSFELCYGAKPKHINV